jgi:DNA-binding CsgD family transcriptional regulator
MIVIRDLDAVPAPPVARLQQLFRLTRAEARLAAALALGQALKDHADTAGITDQTARWYLKQAFQKTETHSQAQRVALLGRLLA